jgi:hypothetical protein
MNTSKVARVLVVTVIILAGSWTIYGAVSSAFTTLSPREHVFTDARPLTENVAIEFTKKVLKTDGYDVAALTPDEYSPNDGKVLWRSTNGDNAEYGVSIDKVDAEIRCRVYPHK